MWLLPACSPAHPLVPFVGQTHKRPTCRLQKNESKCLTSPQTKAPFYKLTSLPNAAPDHRPPITPPSFPSLTPSLPRCSKVSRSSSDSGCDFPHLLTSSFQALEDYAAEYQGDTNPKEMPNFSPPSTPPPATPPFPPPFLPPSLTGQEGARGPNTLIRSHLSVQTAGDEPRSGGGGQREPNRNPSPR